MVSFCQHIVVLVGLLVLTAHSALHAQGHDLTTSFSDERGGVTFTENRGQVADLDGMLRPEILYTTSFAGAEVFVSAQGISYVYQRFEGDWDAWNKCDHNAADFHGSIPRLALYRMDMELVGANPHPLAVPSDRISGYTNYYLAHCPDGVLNVCAYRTVVLKDVYPKIDMVLHGNDRGMKCDFLVHPGGRPSDIQMRYLGGDSPQIVGHGELRVENPLGFLQEDAPYTYQSIPPELSRQVLPELSRQVLPELSRHEMRREVQSRWHLRPDGVVGFEVGPYNPTQTLVIDPTRQWATFYGGAGGERIFGSDVTEVDRAGDIYFTGSTTSATFPVTIGPAFAGMTDIIVVKMKNDGSRQWATLIGGSADELGHGIATDRDRNVFIAGHSVSTNFPLLAAHRVTLGGVRDAIVAKFDTNGLRLWSTYYGGGALDDAYGFAVDTSGNPAVVGVTASTTGISGGGGYNLAYNGGTYDAFLAKFSSSGVFQWGSYIGGAADECGWAAATDINDNITIGGWTNSANFPTSNAFQGALAGGTDCFVMQFNSVGALRWSSYYGGTLNDGGSGTSGSLALATDGDANVLLAGGTASINFPLSGSSIQGAYGGGLGDGFVVKFDTLGARLWATYQGGSGNDRINGVASNRSGGVLVTGGTTSTNFSGISLDAFRSTNAGGTDAFIVRFDAGGTRREYATYYGGIGTDEGFGISFDPGGAIVVAGETNHASFPVTPGCYQPTYGGGGDAFLALFCDIDPGVIAASGPVSFCPGESVTLSIAGGYSRYLWSNGSSATSITVTLPGLYYVDLFNDLGCRARSDTVRVAWYGRPSPVIKPSGTVPLCLGDSLLLDAGPRRYTSYAWYDATLTNLHISGDGPLYRTFWAKTPGTYRVIVVDTTGCIDTSAAVTVVANPKPSPIDVLPLDKDTFSICKGTPLLLAADRVMAPGESFTWTPGGGGPTFTPTLTGDYRLQATNASGCSTLSRSIHLIVQEKPTPNIKPFPNTTICDGDTVLLDARGGINWGYHWSNGDTTSSIRVTSPGLYNVDVTDSNGCKGTTGVTIIVTPRSVARILSAGPIDICQGESTRLDAGPGFNEYRWSTGETTQIIMPKDSGDYTVRVRGGTSNCISLPSNIVTVRVHSLPSASFAGPLAICINSTTSYVARKMPNVKYEWNIAGGGGLLLDGQGTDSITVRWGPVQSAGIVQLRVTDTITSCSKDTLLAIMVGTVLSPTIQTSRSTLLCPGDSVALDAGGGYDIYRWLDSNGKVLSTIRSLTVKDSGAYQVMVTNGNGCTGLSQVVHVRVVDPPVPEVIGPSIVCLNSSTDYAVSSHPGGVYRWRLIGGLGAIISGQGTPRITINWTTVGSGFVMLEESNSITNCTATSLPFGVDVDTTFMPRITTQGSTTLCDGDSILLHAPFGLTTYRWSDGLGMTLGSADMLVVRSAGTYNVEVQSGTCSGSGSIVIAGKPAIVPTINDAGSLCEGDTLILQTDAGYARYRWSTGDSTRSIAVTRSGLYAVRVTDADGCSGMASVAIIANPPPTVTITQIGGDLIASAGVAYQWYLNGDAIPSATTQSWRGRVSGDYSVRVTDSNGCSAMSPVMRVDAGASATIAIRDYQASPGERVLIPLEISDGVSLERNGIRNYRATIRFNRTLLVPVESYPSSYVGDDRILTITGSIPAASTTNGPLTAIEFIAALGDTQQTPITIEAFTFVEDTAITATTINGTFTLTGLCSNGGTRLVNSSGATALRPVRPNPVVDWAEVEYEIVEDGMTRLYLVDVLGGVTPVVHTSLTAGRYVARFDVTGLVPGVYVCVLETATQRMGVVMGVVR
jgi:hypothetical protein